MKIHPNAIVGSRVKLGKDVVVGPGAIIEGEVEVGDETEVGPYAVITGNISIGRQCRIFTGAVIGSPPQDLKYRGEKSFIRIGDRNTIREYVTINPATEEGGSTSVGSDNLIMAYSHIAHNCVIADSTVLANNATLAGHVTIEKNVILGGFCGVHQFCRLGSFAIVGGFSKVTRDVIPYSLSDGRPARVYWLNRLGLKRQKFSHEALAGLEKAFRLLLRSHLNLTQAVSRIKAEVPPTPEVAHLLEFIALSERGLALSRRCKKSD